METATEERNQSFNPFMKHKEFVEKLSNPGLTEYKETFDEFIRSLLALNDLSKMLSEYDVQLLRGLLALWVGIKRRSNV